MYKAFVRAKSGCDKWHDYEMTVAPYENGKPIYYEFTSCPAAEFAIRHGLTDIMPALCNVDYASMELLHARLIRTTTCVNGCRCDYTICGDIIISRERTSSRLLLETLRVLKKGGTFAIHDLMSPVDTAICRRLSKSSGIWAMSV